MQFLAAVLGRNAFGRCLRLVLGTTCTCILLGFLKTRFFVSGRLRRFLFGCTSGLFRVQALFLFLLAFFFLATHCCFFFCSKAFLLTLLSLDPLLSFALLAIELFLLFLRLLFEHISLDIGALLPNLYIHRPGTTLHARKF